MNIFTLTVCGLIKREEEHSSYASFYADIIYIFISVCFGIEVKSEKIAVKMFLFQSSWRKESIVREMTRGPFGNPALMRNDPLR